MKKNKCRAKGCDREVKVFVHKLCAAHYIRYFRTGKIGSGTIRKRGKLKILEK